MDEKELQSIYNAYVDRKLIDPNQVSFERFYSLDKDKAKSLYEIGVQADIFKEASPELSDSFSQLFGQPMPVASYRS